MTLRFDKPVLLIGGGPVSRSQCFEAQAFTEVVVAADSGADTAKRLNLPLAAVIGDMDSVSPEVLAAHSDGQLHDPDQSTTDFEKCLKHIEAPLIIGVGFLAGRLDHELAALNALAKHPTQKVVLIGEGDVLFCCPKKLELRLPQDTRVSVFPMGKVTGLRSQGLQYGLDGLEMASEAGIGTSNSANKGRQIIEVDAGALLVILPREHLETAIRGLHG